MARIVDLQEASPAGGRRSLALASVVVVLLVFAATLEPIQRAARVVLGLAGLAPLSVAMSGTVIDEGGAPIAHAFVRVDQDGELASTYTDEKGTYQMVFSIRTWAPADVSFGANGYEANLRALHVASTESRSDARLHRLVRINAGASAHLVVAPEDGLCYPAQIDVREPDRTWPCRVAYIFVDRVAVLSVTVVPDDPRDRFGASFAVGSEPTLVFATPCCAQSDTARLPEGALAVVQIVALDLDTSGESNHGFTLRTSLEPP
jgi:hypothetical protein